MYNVELASRLVGDLEACLSRDFDKSVRVFMAHTGRKNRSSVGLTLMRFSSQNSPRLGTIRGVQEIIKQVKTSNVVVIPPRRGGRRAAIRRANIKPIAPAGVRSKRMMYLRFLAAVILDLPLDHTTKLSQNRIIEAFGGPIDVYLPEPDFRRELRTALKRARRVA